MHMQWSMTLCCLPRGRCPRMQTTALRPGQLRGLLAVPRSL